MIIYKLNILITACIGGFMYSYCIVIGQYFNYLLKTNKIEGFYDYYSRFRLSANSVKLYGICLLLQFVVAVISLLLNYDVVSLVGQIVAVLVMPVLGILHKLTNFKQSEEIVNSGQGITDKHIENYLKWNIPLHMFYGIMYTIAAFLLIFI